MKGSPDNMLALGMVENESPVKEVEQIQSMKTRKQKKAYIGDKENQITRFNI